MKGQRQIVSIGNWADSAPSLQGGTALCALHNSEYAPHHQQWELGSLET